MKQRFRENLVRYPTSGNAVLVSLLGFKYSHDYLTP